MFQYDEHDEQEDHIILCVNCDAEYTITRFDDEEDPPEPEFCPFCGYQQMEEDYEDDEEEEDDDTLQQIS